jgi:RHS repeat-associated protein
MVQANGTLCYDADFTPFGGEKTYTATCAPNYKFEGKERDTETQNDNFGAREYSWRFGRWLSSDWSAVPVAVPYANLANPQTLNLYPMVADDPESFADLDGHQDSASTKVSKDCAGSAQSGCKTVVGDEGTKPSSGGGQTKSPDPNLPVNNNYRMVVLYDSGKKMGALDAREVTYSLHTAPDDKNPSGNPVAPGGWSLTEHLSNPSLSPTQDNKKDTFIDAIGPESIHKGPDIVTDRYFTATKDSQQIGVIPILDKFGTHIVDHIVIERNNDRTKLNGQYDSTAIP